MSGAAKRAKGDRGMPTELKVLDAGLGRTGTASLQEALEILGFGPCHHMSTFIQHPERCQAFCDAYDGFKMDWRDLMSGYNSAVDHPTTDFVLELMEAFPNALVVLTVRDNAEVWWRSCQDTTYRLAKWHHQILVYPVPFLRGLPRVGRRVWPFMERKYDAPAGPMIYELHNARIKSIVPKKKLLELNVKQGWAPLCEFLGVPVPDAPFPKANETAIFNRQVANGERLGMAIWAALFAILAMLLSLLVQWVKSGI